MTNGVVLFNDFFFKRKQLLWKEMKKNHRVEISAFYTNVKSLSPDAFPEMLVFWVFFRYVTFEKAGKLDQINKSP